MIPGRRPATALAAGALAIGAASSVALGAAAWQPALPIAPSGRAPGDPSAALAPGGEALGAWTGVARAGAGRRVLARERHGWRAPWRGPTVLSPRLPPGALRPATAMNERGDAVIAWRLPGGAVRSAVRRGARGTWVRLPVPGPIHAADPADLAPLRVAVGPGGGASVLWAGREGGVWVVRGARRAGGAAPWRATPPLTAAVGSGLPLPRMALEGPGDAAVAWTDAGAVRAARRIGAGPWGPAQTLAAAGVSPDVAVAPGGTAAVAWADGAPSGPLRLAGGAAGTTAWAPPESPVAAGLDPKVALNARGDLVLGWQEPVIGGAVRAAVRPGGAASFGPAGSWPASDAFAARFAEAAVDIGEDGAAVLGWVDPRGTRDAVLALAAGSAGAWEPAIEVPVGGEITTPALAPGPQGTALALATTLESPAVLAVSRDGLPPVRLAVTVRGRWERPAGAVRWTVRVRNRGRIAARGVQVQIPVTGGHRLLASRPAPALIPRAVPRWRLGRLAPGASRSVVAVIRPPARLRDVWVSVGVGAVSAPFRFTQTRIRRPAGL